MSGVIEETTYKAFKMGGKLSESMCPMSNKAVSSRMNYVGFYIKNNNNG